MISRAKSLCRFFCPKTRQFNLSLCGNFNVKQASQELTVHQRFRYFHVHRSHQAHKNLYNTKTVFENLRNNNIISTVTPRWVSKWVELVASKDISRYGRKPNVLAAVLAVAFGVYKFSDGSHPFGSVDAFSPFLGSSTAAKNFVADVVKNVGPAVVFVEIKGQHPVSKRRVTLANGSGFIVKSNGLVLTNSHVVEKATRVNVKLHDGSSYEGMVTVVDPVCDLAIIKFDPGHRKLPVIPLGSSSTIRPGEFVAAMGSPLSLHRTTTVGIVSSPLRKSKELGLSTAGMEYIQTDAVIGLGNSGGPLVNMDGKAIGINTLKLTDGICFAIPTDYARKLLDKAEMLEKKAEAQNKPNYMPNGKESTRRRYMGIRMLSLTPSIVMELREKYKDFPPITHGVLVYAVIVSSPAYAGGLHAGDVITQINGLPMTSAADIYQLVERSDKLDVSVIRGKHSLRYTVITEAI